MAASRGTTSPKWNLSCALVSPQCGCKCAARSMAEKPPRSAAVVELPDLGDEAKNRKLHGLVSAFVRDIARLIEDDREKGKRR